MYFERLAALSPSERVRLGVALGEAGHSLQWTTTRRRHPNADEAEIAFQAAVTRFGPELVRLAYRKT